MRDWPNPVFSGTLEEACAAVLHDPSVERIGFEVETVDDEPVARYVLAPAYDVGLAPWTGDVARCSDIDFGKVFRVLRVAKGFPGDMLCGNYPDDFPPDRR
ncbi:MAG: hypothetical protein IAI50_11325 [Candidatus Eremiobacteraeota bacterium]|nr:hypothetical protein [Candidatus Eremiobacteraeota bacterium]